MSYQIRKGLKQGFSGWWNWIWQAFNSIVSSDLENLKDTVNVLVTDHATFRGVCSDIKTCLNALVSEEEDKSDGLLYAASVIFANTTASEAFDVPAVTYRIDAVDYKVSSTASNALTASHAVGSGLWGAISVKGNTSDGYTTAVVAASQSYATEASAIALIPAAAASEALIGYITVQASIVTGWSGGMPFASAEQANFYMVDSVLPASVTSSPPSDLSASTVTLATTMES